MHPSGYGISAGDFQGCVQIEEISQDFDKVLVVNEENYAEAYDSWRLAWEHQQSGKTA